MKKIVKKIVLVIAMMLVLTGSLSHAAEWRFQDATGTKIVKISHVPLTDSHKKLFSNFLVYGKPLERGDLKVVNTVRKSEESDQSLGFFVVETQNGERIEVYPDVAERKILLNMFDKEFSEFADNVKKQVHEAWQK